MPEAAMHILTLFKAHHRQAQGFVNWKSWERLVTETFISERQRRNLVRPSSLGSTHHRIHLFLYR